MLLLKRTIAQSARRLVTDKFVLGHVLGHFLLGHVERPPLNVKALLTYRAWTLHSQNLKVFLVWGILTNTGQEDSCHLARLNGYRFVMFAWICHSSAKMTNEWPCHGCQTLVCNGDIHCLRLPLPCWRHNSRHNTWIHLEMSGCKAPNGVGRQGILQTMAN